MSDEQNIYGIKYEVDIEALKTSTVEAGKQIKLANSEFNKSQSELDDWATSVDGVSAKIKQMNTILSAEKSKLAQSQNEYNKTADQISDYARAIDEARAKKERMIESYGAESKEVKEASVEIKKLEREQSALVKTADNLRVSINNQQASVNKTEKSLKGYEEQLADVTEAQKRAEKSGRTLEEELEDLKKATDEVEDSTQEMGDGFTIVKGAIANLIASGISGFISGIMNAVEETREFRMELGKLEATAQTTNSSFDKVKENLREVNSITGDTGAGVEGLNNLLTAGFDGKQLDSITDQLLGASIKWKDTLKFEGLSDGLQETLATGSAIGPFAELIDRAGGDLDKFNTGLKQAVKDGTEQNYVLQYLSKYGLSDVKQAYEENNQTLIDSANATYDLQNAMALFGEKAEPVISAVKSGFAGLLETLFGVSNIDLSPLTNGIQTAFSTINSLLNGELSLGDVIENLYQSFITSAPKFIDSGVQLISNIGAGLQSNIPELISKGLEMVDNFVDMISQNMPKILQSGIDFIRNLVKGLMDSLPELINKVPEIISKFANVINDNAPTIIKAGFGLILDIITGIINAIPTLITNIPKIITAIVDVWEAFNWINLGKKAITLLKDGIASMIGAVKTTATSVKDNVVTAISDLPTTLKNLGTSMMTNFSGAISGAISTVKLKATDIFNAVVNTFKSMPSKMLDIGKNLVKGLWNGISDMSGWVIGKIEGFTSGVLDGIKNFFGVHSPSRETEWIGEMLGKGLGNGISAMSDYAVKKASVLSNDILDSLRGSLDSITVDLDSVNAVRNGVSASANGLRNSGTNTVNNVTFNQYNTSPKALDSLEVYKNTRKQMQQYKLWGGANS